MAAGNGTHLNPTNLRNNKNCEQPNAHLLMAHHALPRSCAWQAKRIPCGRLGIRLINLGPSFAVGKRAKNKNRKNIGERSEPRNGLGRGKGRRQPFPLPKIPRGSRLFLSFFSPMRSLVPGYRLIEEPTNSPYNSTQSCFLYWDIMVNKTSYLHQLTNINKFTYY